MTAKEEQHVRNLEARIKMLERDNRYLRQMRNKARTERDRLKQETRWLHGLCLAANVRVTV